jgi:hypothetical protein
MMGIFIFDSMAKNNGKNAEIRIRGIGNKLHEELNNISDNTGVPLSHILIPKLHEVANSYPDKMKFPKKND